jgi:hypothetical protein
MRLRDTETTLAGSAVAHSVAACVDALAHARCGGAATARRLAWAETQAWCTPALLQRHAVRSPLSYTHALRPGRARARHGVGREDCEAGGTQGLGEGSTGFKREQHRV